MSCSSLVACFLPQRRVSSLFSKSPCLILHCLLSYYQSPFLSPFPVPSFFLRNFKWKRLREISNGNVKNTGNERLAGRGLIRGVTGGVSGYRKGEAEVRWKWSHGGSGGGSGRGDGGGVEEEVVWVLSDGRCDIRGGGGMGSEDKGKRI